MAWTAPIKRDLNNFGPRIGFAWNALPKTVVRGGYGVYFDYVPQDLLIANFTNSAGLATNPIGPQAVVSLGNNYDPTAFDGIESWERRSSLRRRRRFPRRVRIFSSLPATWSRRMCRTGM